MATGSSPPFLAHIARPGSWLGEMAGLSRNSVGPVLKQLEREALVARRTRGEIAFNPVRLAHTLR